MHKNKSDFFKNPNPELNQKIINMYLSSANIGLRTIEREVGISRHKIRELLKQQGVYIDKNNYLEQYKTNRKYDIDMGYFKQINTANKAYVLGLLFADGYMSGLKEKKSEYQIGISLTKSDKDILENIRKDMKYDRPIRIDKTQPQDSITRGKVIANRQPRARLEISSKEMWNDLLVFGMKPSKTETLLPPSGIPDEFIPHFLRGFFDGDGSIGFTFNTYVHKSNREKVTHYCNPYVSVVGTKGMIEWIIEMFLTECPDLKYHKNIDARYSFPLYQLNITNKDSIKKIVNYLYKEADLKLNRKYINAVKILEFLEGNNVEQIRQELLQRQQQKIKANHGKLKHY